MLRRILARRKERHKVTATNPAFVPWEPPSLSSWKSPYSESQNPLSTVLHPHLLEAINNGNLGTIVEEIAPSLYRIPVFSAQFLSDFNRDVGSAIAWADKVGITVSPPNNMNNYGLVVSEIGYGPLMQGLMTEAIRPLAAELFPEVGGGELVEQHSFIVEYGRNRDWNLDFHVDDSDVTLNLCLGDTFTASELYFKGRRCPLHRQNPHRPEEMVVIEHIVGTAILHAGAHRHGAYAIESGRRRNLIMWCRALPNKRNEPVCHPWCGEHSD